MKTLPALLASLVLCGCGGVDESLPAEAATTEAPPLENSTPPMPPEMSSPKPIPASVSRWEAVWTKDGLRFQMVRNPVEERFFYPVDLKGPPGLPLPPCPTCR
ncbi:MAG: hypothetical protein JNJ54_20330 [Myxococcaceae bacterium]|nr:hypothetical protein [Myxococcaceae bacterium]